MTAPPDLLATPQRARPSARAATALPRVLPPIQRPDASLAVLDISEYYGEGSGGVRTYLDAKGRYVAARAELRQSLVVPGARDAVLDAPGRRLYHLRGPAIPFHSYRLMLATRSVARIIAHERPDIVEIGSSYVVPWAVSRARHRHPAKVAWFYHSNLPRLITPELEHMRSVRRVLVDGVGAYVRALGRLADVTLAASAFSARELHHWGVERVERVTLGVDVDHFTPARRLRAAAVRARLGIRQGAPLVGFVGRLAAEKQVEVLLRAWPVVARTTGAMLVIVGSGPQAERLAALADVRTVRMLPHEPDRERLADLVAALDVYASPAPYETFGLSVCEALASGVPVVSVDHGAAAELVRGSGVGGVAPLGEVTAFGRAIIAALAAEAEQARATARRYVVGHHSWEVAFERLFTVYRHLLT